MHIGCHQQLQCSSILPLTLGCCGVAGPLPALLLTSLRGVPQGLARPPAACTVQQQRQQQRPWSWTGRVSLDVLLSRTQDKQTGR